MSIVDLVCYFAGFCAALSFLPQIIKTIVTRSASDVSMGMLCLTLASAGGYEYYSWKLGLIPVVVMNGIFFAMVFLELCLKIYFDFWESQLQAQGSAKS